LVGNATFEAPCVDPAEMMYDVAPGTDDQLTVAVPATIEPVTTGDAGAAVHPPPPGELPIVNANGEDGGPAPAPFDAVTRTENDPAVPAGICIETVAAAPTFRLATAALPAKKSRRCAVGSAPAPDVHVICSVLPVAVALVTVGCPGASPVGTVRGVRLKYDWYLMSAVLVG
jgi:hypothetical protein